MNKHFYSRFETNLPKRKKKKTNLCLNLFYLSLLRTGWMFGGGGGGGGGKNP